MKKLNKYMSIIFVVCIILEIILTSVYATSYSSVEDENIFQKVSAIIEKDKGISYVESGYDNSMSREQTVEIKILSGNKKGNKYIATYTLMSKDDSRFKFDELKVGDKVYVTIDERNEEPLVYVSGTQRQTALIVLAVIFLLAIILLGRKQGIKTIISLVLTVLLVFYYALPRIINGSSPLLVMIIVCTITTVTTYVLIGGFTKKTLASSIGTIGGVVTSGIIAVVFAYFSRISGLNEETMYLAFLPQGIKFDLVEILISGILIGALGACMDVAMSIASSMKEIKEKSPNITRVGLLKSGMNIGKDVMGTMTNTLILAYVGSSITELILYMGYGMGATEIVNIECITEAIIRSLAGSLGLIAVIPITALVSSILYGKKVGGNKDE